ncbi:cobalt-precorrin-5B (C(1))-methyltransferase [Sneathiella glossodoripedis]|uniref:cobalt-precorrin-5B (C(1))-methyltransferase n=1 Tax=Sneathiella glossodoripedis TaxID=418853 RepID=UPI00047226B1|nr:cobalt-precorrin-5B (C(1))-methyltransferase [Sneathiella glossodoripedis]
MNTKVPTEKLRYGWTTGACATAASKSALSALLGRGFLDPVTITLPKGQKPAFSLATEDLGDNYATASVIKDAGDDPDVTHLARIIATVRPVTAGGGIQFRAGEGVGTVTREGLPLAVGEPAINPVPRQMITDEILELCKQFDVAPDFEIEIGIENGAELARYTMNGRLGIKGGLSVLGTTGIVVPYSCAAWIASLHRGIDVSIAAGAEHLIASTGSTSEKATNAIYDLPDYALLDMGDFAGGVLKYLKKHPVPKLTLAGGFAKFTKLAEGHMDLHSGRSSVNFNWLAEQLKLLGASDELIDQVRKANTAMQVLGSCEEAGIPIATHIANLAANTAQKIAGKEISIEVLIFDRKGVLVGQNNDR